MAIQSPLHPSLRAKRGNPATPPPVIASEVKQSSNPLPVIASEAWQSSTPSIKSGGPFYPSDHPEHRIWGSILPFRPPRVSNLGVCFTLPTTPSIESGGHFHLPDSSEVKFGGHSCITDLPDTLIWGSFLHHRPARHPNLGVKLPVPRKLQPPLLPKPTNQSESPHLFFVVPRGNHKESSRKRSGGREELARSAWEVVWRSRGTMPNTAGI